VHDAQQLSEKCYAYHVLVQAKAFPMAMGSSILEFDDQAKAGSIIKMQICLGLISSRADVLRLR